MDLVESDSKLFTVKDSCLFSKSILLLPEFSEEAYLTPVTGLPDRGGPGSSLVGLSRASLWGLYL